MQKTVNEKLIRVSGKVAIEKELELGDDVEIKLSGGIIKTEEFDNQNGEKDVVYVIKPTECQVI